mmetsp:Transcript_4693/g.4381  ORF Transcript_4693/g.4381 Transcript_4693/m.4381 type:complete len:382 (+) Transcript_4693:723-1868(+)
MLVIFRQMLHVLHYLHSNDIIHRDVHPTRFHLVNGKAKFNFIGMPYNYKKLLKKENFSGHINYSAPELILEQMNFSDKVDIWSLGCCLYFLIVKKDPFEGKDPKTIKENILKCKIDYKKVQNEPMLATLIRACLVLDESQRPHAFEILNYMDELEKEVYGDIVSDEKRDSSIELKPSSFVTMSPNTSGSFNKSFDKSFDRSFDNSFNSNSESSFQEYPKQLQGKNSTKNLNTKKLMKLSSKSKEFTKNLDSESTPKTYLKPTESNYMFQPGGQAKRFPALKTVHEAPSKISETEEEQQVIQEENFVLADDSQLSFHTFNTSHLKDDNSFMNSSFNTMLNLNTELEESKGDKTKLKEDLKQMRLPNGYFKIRILMPFKGEMI